MPAPNAGGRSRRHDPARVRAALASQWRVLTAHTDALTAGQLAVPSRLAGWTVNELVAHITLGVRAIPGSLAPPEPERADLGLSTWVRSTAGIAEDIDRRTRKVAADGIRLADAVVAAEQALAAAPDDRNVTILLGAMRLSDYLVTRLVEAVVHADDLDPAFPHDRYALATVTRVFADALAAIAPGGSVEVRVAPYAVVQCVAGPRHTRGTPPNVVETDPLTWIRLATGRLAWRDALDSGRVSASGSRSDLEPWLPLLG